MNGVAIKTISIMGSGWLGLPLSRHLSLKGYAVKASTTTPGRAAELADCGVEPFILTLESLPANIQSFLQANVLVVNIPSKNVEGFQQLVSEIEQSAIEKVVFVSSTSVYANSNKTIYESDGEESPRSPLRSIETLFTGASNFTTTIVRFGGLIGYRRHPGNFFRKGHPVKDPDAYVNLIHRDDCIQIITQIIDKEIWGEAFNCCADTHPTKREFYTQAARSLGKPAPEFVESAPGPYKIISNEKVRQALNYSFLHPDLMKIKFEEIK